jgi:hypothetical protein
MEIKDITQIDPTDIDNKILKDLRYFVKTGSTEPTYRPTMFNEQFYIYINDTTYRLYIYVSSLGSWKYINLT